MKRNIAVFIGLVVVDQLLGWAASSAFAGGQEIGWAFLRIGRWDHYAPIAHFAPLLAATVAGLFALAALFRYGAGGDLYRLFGLPIALIASALTTQIIDMLGRGYAVNYVGLAGAGWVVKITDIAYEGAMIYAVLLTVGGLTISALRGVTHGQKQASRAVGTN